MSANSVALNMTVPSLLRGMFIDTNLYKHHHHHQQPLYSLAVTDALISLLY